MAQIFLLRALLKNRWAAGLAFALLFAALNLGNASHPLFNASISFPVLFGWAFVVLRWGLPALGATLLLTNLTNVPPPRDIGLVFRLGLRLRRLRRLNSGSGPYGFLHSGALYFLSVGDLLHR
ncbi:MAG TPA: hypothetical protein VGH38_17250 [Bryobacteraceae bacterium]|jgi:hypothetical protein